MPSAWYLLSQLWTVCRETLYSLATAATDSPSRTTAITASYRCSTTVRSSSTPIS